MDVAMPAPAQPAPGRQTVRGARGGRRLAGRGAGAGLRGRQVGDRAAHARGCTDADVERACADGRILRTHVLRPTWHFVLPDDIRWMLALTAPRVRAAMAYYDRKLALDERRRSGAARRCSRRRWRAATALTREELARTLGRGGHRGVRPAPRPHHDARRAGRADHQRPAARQAVAPTRCSTSARRGGRTLARDEALAELAGATSPATDRRCRSDFAWWSGLTVGDARRGIESGAPAARVGHRRRQDLLARARREPRGGAVRAPTRFTCCPTTTS